MTPTNHLTNDDGDEPMRVNTRMARGGDSARRVEKNGREYLVTPVVAAREMVLNYPELGRDEYVPEESFAETADLWSGEPIVAVHPDRNNSAKSPDQYAENVIGQVHEPEAADGKLRFDAAWIDVEKANAIGGLASEVVDRLERGQDVAVSTGYSTVEDRTVSGTYDGDSYDLEQGTWIPDHLAMFPPDAQMKARCDLEDGCGAPRVNAVDDPDGAFDERDMTEHGFDADEPPDPGMIRSVLNYLQAGSTDEPDVAEGHEDCECGGECDDCTSGGEAETDENTDPDGGNASDQTRHNSMADTDIEALAEQTAFSADDLREWDDEQIDALEQTIETTEPEPEDDGTDTGADEEAPNPETEGADAATAKQNASDDDIASLVRQNAETIGDLADTVEDLEQTVAQEQNAEEIEIVTNAIDGMDEEAARDLPEDTLRSLAEEHRGQGRQRANYAAVPGPTDRTPETDDVDDWPGGGRSEYEARQGGD